MSGCVAGGRSPCRGERQRSHRDGGRDVRLRPREGDPGDWPHRLDIDGVEGAETQGGAGDRKSSEVNHLERGEGVVTREGPYLARQLSGFVTAGK